MDEQFQNTFQTNSFVKPPRSNRFGLLVILIFIIVLVVVGLKFLGSKKSPQSSGATIIPTPTEYQLQEAVPTTSQAPVVINSPTPPAVNPIDKTTGLDRSKITIDIKNGSGVAGAGSKAQDTLKGFGYRISSVGNADSFDFKDVSIQVKKASSDYLPLLKKDLGFSYTVGSSSADLASSSTADALVIIGK